MKVLRIEHPQKAVIADLPVSKLGKGDVLVKITHCGICGTDFALYRGESELIRQGLIRYPVRIGHEWSGIVKEVGSNVCGFKPGDRVVGDNGVACGICEHCREGRYSECEHIRSVGTINCWDGALAEYIIMPDRHLYHLPDSISMEDAAVIEPACIALTSLIRNNITDCHTLLVIGTGTVGLATVALAKAMDVPRIISCGMNIRKLEIAKKLGADFGLHIAEHAIVEKIKSLTLGKGVDLAVETSGTGEAVSIALDTVRRRGSVALIGFHDKALGSFEIDKVVMKEVQLKGIMGEFGTPQMVIDIMSSKGLSFKPLITQHCTLEQAALVLGKEYNADSCDIKTMVDFT